MVLVLVRYDHVEEGVLMMRDHLPDLHEARLRIMGSG
jgi:hypothetical protein